MGGDDVHEGAADDHAVGDLGDGLDVGGGRDAEADADGQGGVLADLGDRGREVGGQFGALAGHAFARDVVDEAGGVLRDEADARGRRGRGHDEDVGEAVLLRGRDQFVGFFGRAVEDEQAVGAGGAHLGAVAVEAEREQQVVIAVEDDRLVRAGAHRAEHVEQAVVGHAAFEGALGRELVGQAVGERVGEGHAHFEHVGAVLRQGQQHGLGRLDVGVAGADVAHEGRAAFGFAAGERLG